MDRRWGFLLPWCELLRNKIKYAAVDREWEMWGEQKHRLEVKLPMRCDFTEDSDGDEFELEMEWSGEDYFQHKFLQVREALALLAAVAHVDQSVWKYLLVKYCGVKLGAEGSSKRERDVPAEYYLVLDQDEDWRSAYDHDHIGLDMVLFCRTDHRTHPSDEYLRAMKKIAALDTTLKAEEAGVDIVIPVRCLYPSLGLTSDGGPKILENILRSEQAVHEMWGRLEQQEVPPKELRCTFVLEPLVADFEEIVSWSEMATKVAELITKRLCFSEVVLQAQRVAGGSEARKVFGQLMTRLFDTTSRCRELTYRPEFCGETTRRESGPFQIDMLNLDCDPLLRPVDLHAMGSAMVVNKATKYLAMQLLFPLDDIDFNRDDITTHEWWQWVAYTFFSKRARACSSLRSLALVNIRTMCEEEMQDAFTPIVTAKHPEEELFQCSRGQIDERDATLKANAPVRWGVDFLGQPVVDSTTLSFPTPIAPVRTFSDDGNSTWVNVLVPGFGRCQVQRQDLEFSESDIHEASSGGLTSLTLSFEKYERVSSSGVSDFLSAVGPSLKSLTIDAPGRDMTLSETSILEKCPNLEVLSLGGGLVDVLIDVTDLLPSELCRLRTIQWHDIAALSRDLSDSSNPLVKCVRRLRVRLNKTWSLWAQHYDAYNPANFAADVDALDNMLKVNQTIEYFEVVVCERHKQYIDCFRQHHLKPIQCWRKKFPTENKVAFLSVLASSGDILKKRRYMVPSSKTRLYGSDRHVLSQIFSFAGSQTLREVFFRSNGDFDFDRDELGPPF